jgi:hypothetical protein
MTALSEEDMETLRRNLQKDVKQVRRNLSGGPLDGKQIIIPETQETNDVGWWTMHYKLQPAGFMLWVRKP